MNSIFRNLPHKEEKRKRDKINRPFPDSFLCRHEKLSGIMSTPIRFMTLHFRDRRGAAFAPLQKSRRPVQFCNIAAKRVE